MARMRWGAGAPVSWKLNLPALSALVVAATFMPLVKSMSRTWAPAAGWLVVPLVTVPVRVWAAELRVSARMKSPPIAVNRVDFDALIKKAPLLPRCSGERRCYATNSALHRPCDRQSRTTNIHRPVLLPLFYYKRVVI